MFAFRRVATVVVSLHRNRTLTKAEVLSDLSGVTQKGWKKACINYSLRHYAELSEVIVTKRTFGNPTPQSLHGGNNNPKTK